MVTEAVSGWPVKPRIVIEPADKDAAFRTARAALAASGTVTLELAFAGIPTIGAYRIPAVEAAAFRLMANHSLTTVILANLVLGENVVPQYLQGDCTADRMAAGLIPLLGDTPERRRQTDAFARIDAIMETTAGRPSDRAAEAVLRRLGHRLGHGRPGVH
jgi:lipid-A-disaccharide synthase